MLYDLLFCIFLIAFAVIDAFTRIVPNKLLLAFFWFALIVAYMAQTSWFSIILCFLLIIAPMLLLYRKGGIGGGDIKLITAMGIYLGYEMMVITYLISFFLFLIYWLGSHDKSRSLPLAPFLCIGAIISLFLLKGLI